MTYVTNRNRFYSFFLSQNICERYSPLIILKLVWLSRCIICFIKNLLKYISFSLRHVNCCSVTIMVQLLIDTEWKKLIIFRYLTNICLPVLCIMYCTTGGKKKMKKKCSRQYHVNSHLPLGVFLVASKLIGPRQANLVLIAYASSEGSGEPAHPRSLARTFAPRSHKQWVKRNLQTESQIPSPLNGWACAVKICHDRMLEDTNSLDGAQLFICAFVFVSLGKSFMTGFY